MSDEDELAFGKTVDELAGAAWAENEARTVEALRAAIAAAPDKEPFDYAKFAALYWRKDLHHDLDGTEPESVRNGFERDYYLLYRRVQTIAEFAARLEYLDSVSGN